MISEHSVVSPHAIIGQNVQIDPFAVIHEDVIIGAGTQIHSHAILYPGTRLGQECQVFPGAVLGGIPQDLKYQGEYTTLEIGNRVVIRECCTLNRGTQHSDKTVIEDHVLCMAYCHVAHDCYISNNAILSNAVNLAGHVHVGEYSILGGLTAVHQFVKIGSHAMIGGGSMVRKDVPPFIKASREPLSYIGINFIGLKRRGFDESRINTISSIYKEVYLHSNNTSIALEKIENNFNKSLDKSLIVDFIRNSERGIIKGPNLSKEVDEQINSSST